MSKQFTFNPKLDFAIERFIDAPTRLVWEALTKPEHLKEWYMPKAWGRVSRAEMDVRPGGIFSIDIATGDGQEVPNLGCFLEVIPMERLVWTSMLFPGYRPAVFDDIPITAIITMETVGTGTRYVFTALHRDEADLEKNKASGFYAGHRDRRRSVRGAREVDEIAPASPEIHDRFGPVVTRIPGPFTHRITAARPHGEARFRHDAIARWLCRRCYRRPAVAAARRSAPSPFQRLCP